MHTVNVCEPEAKLKCQHPKGEPPSMMRELRKGIQPTLPVPSCSELDVKEVTEKRNPRQPRF